MPRLRIECPACHKPLSRDFLHSAVGRLNNSLRRTRASRPKVLRPCPYCLKRRWGASELRGHKPQCQENPKWKARRGTHVEEPTDQGGPFEGIVFEDHIDEAPTEN